MTPTLVSGCLLSGLLAAATASAPGLPAATGPARQEAQAALEAAFAERGLVVDLARGTCAVAATVLIRDDLLEYVLVNRQGAAHESLFMTEVVPSELNTALLALGVEQGTNATWKAKDPQPSEAELRAGVRPYVVLPPEGDGFFLYAGWREGDDVWFVRVEDLVRNLATGRTMQRHRWTYIGSRMVTPRRGDGGEVFAADLELNLVNLVWFQQGNTLVTPGLEDCLDQTIWLPNAWLLPERGEPVLLVFAREAFAQLPPPELVARLPEARPPARADEEELDADVDDGGDDDG
jgi:hypothetical protein